MITEAALPFLEVIVDLILSIFGLLPEMPAVVVEAVDWLFSFLDSGVGLLYWLIPKPIVVACVAPAMAIFLFEQTFGFIVFILKKIPFLGIK